MPKLSETPWIAPDASVVGSRLGRFTEIQAGSRLLNVEFGDYSYTDRFADIANATIGKFANIASFTRINPGDHPMERASQHHFMYRASYYWTDAEDEAEIFARRAAKPVVLGADVWVGAQAIVLSDRTIGDGAVVAAGAVLTKDVPPYEIWGGAPARKLRDRHPPAVAERLQALRWWDWSHAQLRAALPDFRALSVAAFLEKYESTPPPMAD
ncbi:MAG: chloramphenicol acetyltransferase [Neomegalonema sp.]|nr:chloramphenicol acetyltransferase [Neomegalonema sp.]